MLDVNALGNRMKSMHAYVRVVVVIVTSSLPGTLGGLLVI